VAEFEFGLEEVRRKPVDRGVRQRTVAQFVGGRPGDRGAGAEHGLVVTQHFLVADLRIDTTATGVRSRAVARRR
jgi:hypothetical protein